MADVTFEMYFLFWDKLLIWTVLQRSRPSLIICILGSIYYRRKFQRVTDVERNYAAGSMFHF